MSKSTNNTDVILPSELERRQIFFWLQRISSVTAWRRIFELYKAWTCVIENSVRIAGQMGWENQTSLTESSYVRSLKDLAHCEKGVLRLKNGDKKIFKFDHNGEFVMAGYVLSHWNEMLNRLEWGDNGINKNTPLWPQFCETLLAVSYAWGECGPQILEPRYLDEPGRTNYGEWLKNELTTMQFPGELAPVPDPIDNSFVKTNEWTPCSGIWEPIDVPVVPSSSMFSIFSRSPRPQPPFHIAGAMNYLHGGSKAPRVCVETADDNIDVDTTWRLLWRDDRYQDGTVPAIEAQYRFKQPENLQATRPAFWITGESPWAISGDAAAIGGKWVVQADPGVHVSLPAGAKLPLHENRKVRWIPGGTRD